MKGDHNEMPVNFSRPVRDWLRAVLWPGDRWNEWNRATKARSFLQLKCPQGKRWLSPNTSHYRTLSIIKWVSNSRCRLLLVVDNFPLVQHDLIAIPSLSQPASQPTQSVAERLFESNYLFKWKWIKSWMSNCHCQPFFATYSHAVQWWREKGRRRNVMNQNDI